MLLQVGRREASETVVDLLAECHGRIRKFLGMAQALVDAPPQARPQDIVDVANQVRRYFVEGLPLHAEDEDVDIAPQLSADVAARIGAEHRDHQPAVAQLVEHCRELERAPERLATISDALRTTVRELTAQLAAHLTFEETVAFPEIRRFDEGRQRQIRDAMRARRVLPSR